MFTSQNTSAQRIVKCALKYKGKLQHISTDILYTISDPAEGAVANDFMLLFCDRLGDVPEFIKEEVNKRYHQTKADHQSLSEDNYEENPLRMCCWDFCFLVLHDAGIVTTEEINDICQIIQFKNKQNSNTHDIVYALYQHSIDHYAKADINNLPSPGDILLFKRHNENRAWHAAIAIDNKGNFIELNSGRSVTIKNIQDINCDKQDIYVIPAKELKKNIKQFINDNKDCLSENPSKISSAELFNKLKSSQYESICKQQIIHALELNNPSTFIIYQKLLEIQEVINHLQVIFNEMLMKISFLELIPYFNFFDEYEKMLKRLYNEPDTDVFASLESLIEKFNLLIKTGQSDINDKISIQLQQITDCLSKAQSSLTNSQPHKNMNNTSDGNDPSLTNVGIFTANKHSQAENLIIAARMNALGRR